MYEAILYAWLDETDRPRYQQSGKSQRICPATRDMEDQDLHEPEKKTNIMNIMNITNINLFSLSFRFESHIVDHMHNIPVQDMHLLDG